MHTVWRPLDGATPFDTEERICGACWLVEDENQEAAFEKAWREEAARRLQRIQEGLEEAQDVVTRRIRGCDFLK